MINEIIAEIIEFVWVLSIMIFDYSFYYTPHSLVCMLVREYDTSIKGVKPFLVKGDKRACKKWPNIKEERR